MADLTFAAHRFDGGWGVPPQAAALTAMTGDERVTLSWSVPENTVIDGKEICRAAGLVIRKSTTGYPADENSGDLVIKSANLTGSYVDLGLTNETQYYYSAFAFSDHNVFNRNASKATATPTEATIVTIQTPSAFNGKTLTATDGTHTVTAEVSNGTAQFAIYYTGTWDIAGIKMTIAQLGQQISERLVAFAFHYSENDSSPASVSYPEGYDNYGWTPFAMNLSTGVPSYGGWDPEGANAEKLAWFYPKSCMLKYDGTVDYYLKESDETKKLDGTASDVANTSYGGNAMMEWGQDGKKIYWKLVPDSDGKGFTWIVANGTDGTLKAWNHYDANGGLTDHFYTAKYFGSNVSSKLRSISGQSNMVSQTRNTEVTYARANNTGTAVIWDTEVYADWLLIGMLCCLMGKSMNSQAKFGSGRCASGNSSAIGIGTMNGKGQFFGKSDQTSGVKVFGMENPWGNLWRAIRGLVTVASNVVKVKLTHGTEDGSTASDYNFDGTGYMTRSAMSGTSGGYTNAMDISEKGLTPKTISGSETTYYTDGAWFAANCYAIVGGAWSIAGHGGALCVSLNTAASDTYANIGAALSCKPLAAA